MASLPSCRIPEDRRWISASVDSRGPGGKKCARKWVEQAPQGGERVRERRDRHGQAPLWVGQTRFLAIVATRPCAWFGRSAGENDRPRLLTAESWRGALRDVNRQGRVLLQRRSTWIVRRWPKSLQLKCWLSQASRCRMALSRVRAVEAKATGAPVKAYVPGGVSL